jgi:hypothetical protein
VSKPVPRPNGREEYLIFFAGSSPEKGWRDCLSQSRGATIDCWDQLTNDPMCVTNDQYRLQGDLSTALHEGAAYEQWQYKISRGARIRYLIDKEPVTNKSGKKIAQGRVIIREAESGHPQDTL